jgi:glycosyltransferase involved in cell wall biosynthesis
MATAISFILVIVALLLALLVIVFGIEIIASIIGPSRSCSTNLRRPSGLKVAVVVPAHNEGTGLLPTISDVKSQMGPGDRLLVVADNCTDDTAVLAASAGSEVVERNEPNKRGKGFAIACGLQHLRLDPPDIVIVIDADCRLTEGVIDELTATCAHSGRPAQANDLMVVPGGASVGLRVAEFAHLVKDTVRPLGLKRLGLPCQLMGTGMAFPWEVIRSAELASGLLVEDLKLGLDLASGGHPPIFCPTVTVISEFPTSEEGIQSQRMRWERGRLGMILLSAPGLILAALLRANLALLVLSLDMAVPPIILLGILIAGMCILTGIIALFGGSAAAFVISLASAVALVGSIALAWWTYGRQSLPPRLLLSIPSYVLGKIVVYKRILSSDSALKWIRTDRRKS